MKTVLKLLWAFQLDLRQGRWLSVSFKMRETSNTIVRYVVLDTFMKENVVVFKVTVETGQFQGENVLKGGQ